MAEKIIRAALVHSCLIVVQLLKSFHQYEKPVKSKFSQPAAGGITSGVSSAVNPDRLREQTAVINGASVDSSNKSQSVP